jgi:membrane-associated protein
VDPSNLLDAGYLVRTAGTLGVIAIVFAETGLLAGFFFPGDSLLFTAGLFCSPGRHHGAHLNLAIILPGVIVAAIVGAQVGYLIGRRIGPPLLRRPDSRLFKREYVERAQAYFDRQGPRTILLARFIPIVRTFANPMAGVAGMDARTFTIFNVVGGFVWAGGVTVAGYELGDHIANVDHYLLPIIGVVVVLSFVPVALELLRARRARDRVP